jgi:hypothetical protein
MVVGRCIKVNVFLVVPRSRTEQQLGVEDRVGGLSVVERYIKVNVLRGHSANKDRQQARKRVTAAASLWSSRGGREVHKG